MCVVHSFVPSFSFSRNQTFFLHIPFCHWSYVTIFFRFAVSNQTKPFCKSKSHLIKPSRLNDLLGAQPYKIVSLVHNSQSLVPLTKVKRLDSSLPTSQSPTKGSCRSNAKTFNEKSINYQLHSTKLFFARITCLKCHNPLVNDSSENKRRVQECQTHRT